MSSRNIFIIALILWFLPNFIFAATINSIIPDRGGAGGVVVINGDKFGDKTKSIDYGFRYVRVGGFINTKISSWSDSIIKISAPTLQEATSDITRLNPFWLAGDLVSLGFLTFAVKLFDATVSPVSADIDNTVAVIVITPPLQESNQGFFTYTAQPPLMVVIGDFNNLLSIAYDSFGADIVGLLTNPKELIKTKGRETVRGIQEVPLFVRDLFTGKDPSHPLTKDSNISDQKTTPQQTINQTATQEKQPTQEQLPPAKLDTKNVNYSEDEIKDWNVLSYDTWSIKYPKRCINANVYAEASVCLSDQNGDLDSDIDLRLLRYGIRTEEGMMTDICGNNFNECVERHTKYPGIKIITSTPKNFNGFRGIELIYSIEYQKGEYKKDKLFVVEVESSTKSKNVLEIEQNNSSPYIDDIYKKILSTLKRKDIIQQSKSTQSNNSTPPQNTTPTTEPRAQQGKIPALDKATAEKVILQKLKTDYLHWPTTAVNYDNETRGYYDIFGKLNNSYTELEDLGLITVIVKGDLFTTAKVQFTAKADQYLVKDGSGKIQNIVEALPEKVGVTALSTSGWDIGYSCNGDCYVVDYTATYQATPFGTAFQKSGKEYKGKARVAPASGCWEVSTALIHTADTKKICL